MPEKLLACRYSEQISFIYGSMVIKTLCKGITDSLTPSLTHRVFMIT